MVDFFIQIPVRHCEENGINFDIVPFHYLQILENHQFLFSHCASPNSDRSPLLINFLKSAFNTFSLGEDLN